MRIIGLFIREMNTMMTEQALNQHKLPATLKGDSVCSVISQCVMYTDGINNHAVNRIEACL